MNNTEQVQRLRTISTCLKDACELDNARYAPSNPNYVKPSKLQCESSRKMVKVAVQISERKAEKEIEEICYNKPEMYDSIVESLQQGSNPKEVVESCKRGEQKVTEEAYGYGQSAKK